MKNLMEPSHSAEEVAPYGQELILKTDTRPLPSLSVIS